MSRRAEPAPLRLTRLGRPIGFTTHRAAAHRLIDRQFNRALKSENRVDGFMIVMVERDEHLETYSNADGRWSNTSDLVAALHVALHSVTQYWLDPDAEWGGLL